jgi:hypothetical protein
MAAGLLAISVAPSLACDTCSSKFKPGTHTGSVQRVGNGVAYSWVKLNEKGKPTTIGVTLTESSLSGLPQTLPPGAMWHEWELEVPKEAGRTPFKHIVVGWNPNGHIPKEIYDKPHFDFHFYTITSQQRMKITAKGDDLPRVQKRLSAEYVAPGYIYAPGGEEPMMGAHWVDTASGEFNGQPFTTTFIYGSYDGKMNFWEPMITKAYIESKPDVTIPVKQPAAYPESAYYPTSYSIRFDPERREHTVALEGLTWREGLAKQTARKPGGKQTSKTAKAR